MKRIIVVSIVLLFALIGLAGNLKKRATKVAAPLASAGAYVVSPKQVYDVAGKVIGFVDSEGGLVINGQKNRDIHVGRDGMLVDKKGKTIGFVPLGSDEVLGDPGKKRVLTPGPNGSCVIPERNPLNQRMLEPGESIPVCGKTVEEVMSNIQVMFGNACKAGVEQILYVVRLPDGRHELRRGDNNDGTSKSVEFRPRLAKGEIIVGIIHDHPDLGQSALWPSEMDAVTAMKHNTNIYVHDCKSDGMSVAYLHKPKSMERVGLWKKVMLVKDGKPTEALTMPERTGSCNGHDAYDESQYEQYAAGKYSQTCDSRPAAKTQTLGSVRTGAGGYCQCANPQIWGHGAYVGKVYKSKYKTQHLGAIGFVCVACGCPNKTLQKQAKAWKASQEAEGLPTQWYDFQMQYVENMKNRAGDR